MGDVYFTQTELLLPFDGSNGATATSDLSDNNHSVTFAGNAQISTAQSKVGGSSIYFDGSGDYISTPSSSAFAFGTADFTIELWVRRTGTGSYPYVFDCRSGGSEAVVPAIWLLHTDNYKPQYYVNSAARISSSVGLSVDTWYHIAIVRSSGTTTMYMDGSSVGSFSDSFSYIAAPFRLGSYSNGGYGFTGYVDDFRTTKGIARYTSSFTPPTTAHLTSAGDVNKQILVNETADGVAIGTGGINQSRIAKAWVSFNARPSTLDILDSYNISSVTDHGTGDYEVIFATAMSDANYSQMISSTGGGTNGGYGIYSKLDRSTTGQSADDSTTTSFGISNGRYGYGVRYDCSRTTAVIFGN